MISKRLITFGNSVAIAVMILGLIHNVATFTPMIKGGLTCLPPGNLKAMIYMSLICGTSFILSGMLFIVLFRKVSEHAFLSLPILIIGIFLAVGGIVAVICMFYNPFAWIAFFLNLILFGIAIRLRIACGKK
jgi:hypothetical protein